MERGDGGKWDVTQIMYESVTGEKTKVKVTEEARPIIEEIKRLDENRLKREKYWREKGFSEVFLDVSRCGEESSDDESALTRLEQIELKSDLENAIGQLSIKQQFVIRQKYIAGISTSEIARIEDVKMSAISHLEKRGLEKLKKILKTRQQIA